MDWRLHCVLCSPQLCKSDERPCIIVIGKSKKSGICDSKGATPVGQQTGARRLSLLHRILQRQILLLGTIVGLISLLPAGPYPSGRCHGGKFGVGASSGQVLQHGVEGETQGHICHIITTEYGVSVLRTYLQGSKPKNATAPPYRVRNQRRCVKTQYSS